MKLTGMNLKETQIDSTLSYDGNFLKVRKDNARMPDGSVSSREYITHPGAVAILALLDNGKLMMERQFAMRRSASSSKSQRARSTMAKIFCSPRNANCWKKPAMSHANGYT